MVRATPAPPSLLRVHHRSPLCLPGDRGEPALSEEQPGTGVGEDRTPRRRDRAGDGVRCEYGHRALESLGLAVRAPGPHAPADPHGAQAILRCRLRIRRNQALERGGEQRRKAQTTPESRLRIDGSRHYWLRNDAALARLIHLSCFSLNSPTPTLRAHSHGSPSPGTVSTPIP